jgi:hypothetical protein
MWRHHRVISAGGLQLESSTMWLGEAEEFCSIRSYLATAARHGIPVPDSLTSAFPGQSWIPETG